MIEPFIYFFNWMEIVAIKSEPLYLVCALFRASNFYEDQVNKSCQDIDKIFLKSEVNL